MQGIRRGVLGVALVAALASPLAVLAAGDVPVSLSAHRVQVDTKGKETFTAGDEAKPGEIIEYRAVYHNAGSASVTGLVATLPIPRGMEYLPTTAKPGKAEASLDGTTFAPIPLTRRVKRADGTVVVE